MYPGSMCTASILSPDTSKFNTSSVPISLLDQAVARTHDKELPFAVVSVLAFGDTRFADIHRKLATIGGF